MEPVTQGRIKVLQASKACLEFIYSWPKSVDIRADDPDLFMHFAIVWDEVDKSEIEPFDWEDDTLWTISNEWLKIPTNFTMDATVKMYSMKMLATLLNIVWNTQLSIHMFRKYSSVFKKAASDIEASKMAGFLKLSAIRYATKPELLIFNDVTRKIPKLHFCCTVNITRRGICTGENIRNFYAMKNFHGVQESKVI